VDLDAASRLRAEAEARPLKLPVRRRVDERHHHVTPQGLGVWFTIQVSPHARIYDAVFERQDRMPDDEEIRPWLAALAPGHDLAEAPAIPGSYTRRFEAFDRAGDAAQAPIA
jgi:hypothetical protein